jgi:L-lactate dehydrogenase complex protein LldF
VLVHLRGRVVREVKPRLGPERLAMDGLSRVFQSRGRYERAQRMARAGNGPISKLPGPLSGWTAMRELPDVPKQTFRDWWQAR